MWKKISPFLQFFLGWPLSILALIFIIRAFAPKVQEVQSSLTHIQPLLLILGILSFVGYYYLRGIIWHKLLKLLSYEIPIKDSLFLWASSQIKRYIPGNIWSYLGLAVLFEKHSVKKRDTAYALVVESQIVLIASSILSLLALTFTIDQILPFSLPWWSKNVITSLILIGTVVYLFIGPFLHRQTGVLHKVKKLFPVFKPSETLFLLFLMICSYLCFGMGYYLSISSVVSLSPEHLPLLIGYFVLSLLIGFLSFITPTGLGVREGMIAIGLTKFMISPLAGFAAIFSRVVLVIAEIIFLGCAYALSKVKQRHLVHEISYIMKHQYEAVLVILFGIFSLYFSAVSFLRFDEYYTGRFDLGNMAQTVWNTLHGRIFEFTNPDGVDIVSRLAFHADFILVLFAPFYFIWESPKVLLLLQTLIVGAGVFFVYALSQHILKNKALSLTLSFLYLLNPSIERAIIYDFHAVTLTTTFLLGAFYFVYRKKYWWFLLFAVFAAITKEQIWAIIALFGLYIVFIQKNIKLGIGVFIIGALSFYLLLWHAIPNAAGSTRHFALSYYSSSSDTTVADSPSSIVAQYITSPEKIVHILTDKERQNYINQLLSPVGYLPALSPLYLIFAGPDLGINLLSSRPQLYQIYYQYTAAITPFLFIATIFGIAFLRKRIPRLSTTLIVSYLLGVGLFSAYLYGPLPGSKDANLDMFIKPFPQKDAVNSIIEHIPQTASVAASNSIGSHLAHRELLYTLPYGYDSADYVIFNLADSSAMPSLADHKTLSQSLRYNPNYILLYDANNIVVFVKRNIGEF